MASVGAVAQWPLRHTVGEKSSRHGELIFFPFQTFYYSCLFFTARLPAGTVSLSEHQTLVPAYS